MPGKLVTLTQMETRFKADVLVAMLSAYGIYAVYLGWKESSDLYSIKVVNIDLANAQALLVAAVNS
ncbi:hypothetical protein SAMN03159496_00196 [Rhizobium sp. NFR07]|uniref:hypothetical protein n=1 Tax=Rhizobium sp. NFR07 TaxID=1566262 RepID=UPI0008EF9C1D|nr:hypothetical protein [Rhizobium sp. NFR07]SFA75981.1 hypothetical protein SAMN03159496_00196 [Rhizobium sp. NFR07]